MNNTKEYNWEREKKGGELGWGLLGRG